MRKIKKMVICIILILIALIIGFSILLGIFEGGFFLFAPNHNKMDRYLQENIDELTYVSKYLLELDYDYVLIRKFPLREEDKENMFVVSDTNSDRQIDDRYSADIPIPDGLRRHVEILFENGFIVVSRNQNSVEFTRWSIIDESRGIVYSVGGQEPSVGTAIEVKPLSISSWYYYVCNFEKWKARNPQLFQ